jgi:hypothetical protein
MSGESKTPQIKRYVIQVNPGRPRLGIDLTLCPKSVIPDARNQKTEFIARIYAFKGGKWVYPGETRKITFSFKEVSKERGICMNYPIKKRDNISPASAIESNTNPDLFFPEDDDKMKDFNFDDDETDADANKKCPTEILVANDNPTHSHHYKKATTKKAVTEAKVLVRCEDYGAFGILKAEAEDCETLKPREKDAVCSQELGDNDIKIPRDDNGNNIADGADQDKLKDGSKALPDKDEDDVPHSTNHKGDGLTNYEEYRGFIVKEGNAKKHKRTDINNKDVFIHDVNDLKTGNFSASGLTVHRIPGPEFYNGDSNHDNEDKPKPDDRQIINFNRTSHSGGDQHGLRLKDKSFAGNTLGYTYAPLGDENWPTYPKFCNLVAVDRTKLLTMVAGRLAKTITHELGHAVHIVHHGEEDICPVCHYCRAGSQTSGNVSCVMRYGPNYDSKWCHDHGGACHNHNVPNPEAVATQFCDSSTATGCNVGGTPCSFNNNATVGNCIGQIVVKDP